GRKGSRRGPGKPRQRGPVGQLGRLWPDVPPPRRQAGIREVLRMSNKHAWRPATLGRRAFLATGAAALAMPMVIGRARAEAKPVRISTPGSPEEWQSKALEQFKAALDQAAPGQFDVQIHYNGTLFAQGTEIEAMQRGNLEVGLISPQDITNFIPEYSIFTTG